MSHASILVTGGAGFIGSHLVERLIAEGRRVRILDSLELPTHRGVPRLPLGAEFVRGDIREPADLDRALHSIEAVVHLAATGGFTADVGRYIEVNALGTARLLEAAARHRIRKIVVASSVAVYGEGTYRCQRHGLQFPPMRAPAVLERREWEPRCHACGEPLEPALTNEEKPLVPTHPYGISKLAEERLVLASEIPSVALRFFLTYGPRQSLTNPYTGVVSLFSTRLLNGLPPLVYEDGSQTRDFVFVDDAASAVGIALDRADGLALNVGTGTPTSIGALAGTLARLYGRSLDPECPGDFRAGEARHLVADASRLHALGWKPHVTLEEGLARYAEWLGSQEEVPDAFGGVLEELRRSRIIRRSGPVPNRSALSVIIPAYNEAGNLESIVRRLLAELPRIAGDFEILVIDDGSRDGTGPIADRLAAEEPGVRVAHHPFNIGFGGAQKSGFALATKEWVVVVPADRQFEPGDLALLWARRQDADLVASRRVSRHDPRARLIVSRIYNVAMRWIYGIRLSDINWVKLWRRSLFESIVIESPGFGVDAEIVAKAMWLGWRITEVDVPHHPRVWGTGAGVRVGTVVRTARELLRIRRMKRRLGNEAGTRVPGHAPVLAADGRGALAPR